jgi:large subunit ribosomal protein L4
MGGLKMKAMDVLNQTGTKVEEVSLNKDVFGVEVNNGVIYDAVQVYMSNSRQATAKTKKRDEVSGGGRKPWRQKGTGRARQGSTRSPQWRGGGVVFGPTGEQSFKLKQNRKEARLALKSVLSDKVNTKDLILVNEIKYEKPQTKQIVEMLKTLNAKNKTLFVVSEDSVNYEALLSMSNLSNVMVLFADEINVYDVLNSESVVMTLDAMKSIEEVLA